MLFGQEFILPISPVERDFLIEDIFANESNGLDRERASLISLITDATGGDFIHGTIIHAQHYLRLLVSRHQEESNKAN